MSGNIKIIRANPKAHEELREITEDLFCVGDDEYKSNVRYVIGLDKNKLYSHSIAELSVIFVDSPFSAVTYEHFTDAKIAIHGLYRDVIKEAGSMKVFKVVCGLKECENYINDERA